jgi:hypothetical protein
MSFPPATEMFQFTGFASRTYGFSAGYSLLSGLPHSEIPGSTIARISPGLFAACHVLHRLLAPRHPPNALTSTLDRKTRRPQGQAPQDDTSRMKTLSSLKRLAAASHQLSATASPKISLFTLSKITALELAPNGKAFLHPILDRTMRSIVVSGRAD